jgi:tRNA A37 threonylcarbamoyladenosine modification protein TsaB
MILYINTMEKNVVEIGFKNGDDFLLLSKITVERTQGEKLLPAIDKILKKNKFKLKDIEAVEVKNAGGSFTSLRIGVSIANALAFALGVQACGSSGEFKAISGFSVVEPEYDRGPDIGNAKY